MTGTRPCRIALVYDAVYPYVLGGAERRFKEIGVALTKTGYDVHLYGMKYWDGPDVIREDGLTLHGLCRARPLYTAAGRRTLTQPLIFGLSCLRLLRADFDVIDCCGFPYFSLFSCKLAAATHRVPLIATWHEVWGPRYWRSYLGRLGAVGAAVERLASRLPGRIIAVSRDTAERLRDELAVTVPISLIPNGVDCSAIDAVEPAPGGHDVIYVGRLVDFKNVDLVVRTVAALNSAGRRLTAVIVGAGPEEENLRDLARSLGIADQVEFTGRVEQDREVYGLMKSARVLVSPSGREGFGITVLEAAACGIPAVTTNQRENAARLLVTPGTGLVVDPTEDALGQAVLRLLDDPLSPADCRSHAKDYDWESAASRTVEALGLEPTRSVRPAGRLRRAVRAVRRAS
jgi:glycosyltransferase involved in cell wall biosynthesis